MAEQALLEGTAETAAKVGEEAPHGPALSGGGRPVETPERSRERIVALRASHVANIKRLIRKLEVVVKYPGDDWCELEALDAARFVWDADGLDTLMQDALFDLRCDREGYPLTDEGDRDLCGDRQYTPMRREIV